MERCLTTIIARHNSRFYIGPRNGLRHLSSSSPFYNQIKTPPAKNKAQPKESKKAEAIVTEVARQIALTKTDHEANDRREETLLKALLETTPKLRFCGDIIIKDSPSDAIATAREMSSKSYAARQYIVFFVDGSMITKPKKKSKPSVSGSKSDSLTLCGAAVVRKTFKRGQGWQERHFVLLNSQSSVLVELFAIAQGLAVATEEIMGLRSQDGIDPGSMTTNYKVIIFSDSQSALAQVKRLREEGAVANDQVFNDPIIRKIITRSQHLRHIGVHHELHWVAGHSGVKGNVRADAAAQQAAKAQDISIRIDEGLRLIEVEAASKTTNKQPPSPKRQQKEKPVTKKRGGSSNTSYQMTGMHISNVIKSLISGLSQYFPGNKL